jgi:riboflavin kinase/FMN adenylyltransferase
MKIHNSFESLNSIKNPVVTTGTFDGVHVGHQVIISRLKRLAIDVDGESVLITFHPHPLLVVNDEVRPYYLTLPDERARLMGEMGVEVVLTYPFDRDTSQMSSERFISQLVERFHFSDLWVGYDFALGKDREGTPARLKDLGAIYDFEVHEIPALKYEGELVSSSAIRKRIREGDVKGAARLLGRPFVITGDVIRGENRGKSLGFPTSNLFVPPDVVDIHPGVYACEVDIGGEVFNAVTNVGFRPTFDDGIDSPQIEAHLLDFSRDLYGQHLRLSFIDRLRDEKKFEDVSDLIHQIQLDITEARQILK